MIRYADSQVLPTWVMQHPDMTELWRQVNLNMSLTNDLFSLKKEIKHGHVDSVVPVIMAEKGVTGQEAVNVRDAKFSILIRAILLIQICTRRHISSCKEALFTLGNAVNDCSRQFRRGSLRLWRICAGLLRGASTTRLLTLCGGGF